MLRLPTMHSANASATVPDTMPDVRVREALRQAREKHVVWAGVVGANALIGHGLEAVPVIHADADFVLRWLRQLPTPPENIIALQERVVRSLA